MTRLLRAVLGVCLLGLWLGDLPAQAQEPGPMAAPNEKLDYLLSSWRGKSLEDLRGVWGREEEIQLRRGNRVFVFERRVKVRAGLFGVSVYANGGLRCVAQFEVNDADEIVRTSRQGGGQECWNALRRYEP
jgi:hypothetical protein